ncbi:MAG: helix-turn-helix transcriptional regulator [Treponema sp.]|nr:helix-turn-helix transcriptional regulator [Treponema sp.]
MRKNETRGYSGKHLLIMSGDHFSAFLKKIETRVHRHWMLQFFLSLDAPLDLNVNGNPLSALWVLVNTNVQHRFSAKNMLHFTMLMENTSSLAVNLQRQYLNNENGFAIMDNYHPDIARQACADFLGERSTDAYKRLVQTLFSLLGIELKKIEYDKRIIALLQKLDECDCSEHTVEAMAREIFLSSSRLAHLFKDETGMPLKSYIVLHKLQKAYEILLEGRTSITDAAMMAGFDSPSHLAAVNSSIMGLSAGNLLKDSEFLKVMRFLRV